MKDILANGLRQSTRTRISQWLDQSGQLVEEKERIKGLWCYPYTRNKTLNNQWKKNLKTWERRSGNYNGVVFRLTKEDFPLFAGSFIVTRHGDQALMRNMDDLKRLISKFPSGTTLGNDQKETDTDEFEIVLTNKVKSDRIIKIIKDRTRRKNYPS